MIGFQTLVSSKGNGSRATWSRSAEESMLMNSAAVTGGRQPSPASTSSHTTVWGRHAAHDEWLRQASRKRKARISSLPNKQDNERKGTEVFVCVEFSSVIAGMNESMFVCSLTSLFFVEPKLLCVDEGAVVAGRCSRGRVDVNGVRRVGFREWVSAKRVLLCSVNNHLARARKQNKSWMNNRLCVRACVTTPRCSCHTWWCGRCDAALTLVCETLFARLLS